MQYKPKFRGGWLIVTPLIVTYVLLWGFSTCPKIGVETDFLIVFVRVKLARKKSTASGLVVNLWSTPL